MYSFYNKYDFLDNNKKRKLDFLHNGLDLVCIFHKKNPYQLCHCKYILLKVKYNNTI